MWTLKTLAISEEECCDGTVHADHCRKGPKARSALRHTVSSSSAKSRMLVFVCQVLNRRFPPTHVVVTPNFWLNWFGPTFFPGRIVDIEISRRFKLRR